MKVIIEFDVNWEDYENVHPELIIEDMFDNWAGKEGVELKSYKVEK